MANLLELDEGQLEKVRIRIGYAARRAAAEALSWGVVFACDYCSAGPGEPCHVGSSRSAGPHAARFRQAWPIMAREQERALETFDGELAYLRDRAANGG